MEEESTAMQQWKQSTIMCTTVGNTLNFVSTNAIIRYHPTLNAAIAADMELQMDAQRHAVQQAHEELRRCEEYYAEIRGLMKMDRPAKRGRIGF